MYLVFPGPVVHTALVESSRNVKSVLSTLTPTVRPLSPTPILCRVLKGLAILSLEVWYSRGRETPVHGGVWD